MEAPGQDLSLLLEPPLNAGAVMCSNNINKCNSSHRENLVFTVNSASKHRHRFVFCSLTPFIISVLMDFPQGPEMPFFYLRLFPVYLLCLCRAASCSDTGRLSQTAKAAKTPAASPPRCHRPLSLTAPLHPCASRNSPGLSCRYIHIYNVSLVGQGEKQTWLQDRKALEAGASALCGCLAGSAVPPAWDGERVPWAAAGPGTCTTGRACCRVLLNHSSEIRCFG